MFGLAFHIKGQHKSVFSVGAWSIGFQTILRRNLLKFINEKYPNGHRLWQDNDPKHTKEWMKANGVNHWPTPPESPVSNY